MGLGLIKKPVTSFTSDLQRRNTTQSARKREIPAKILSDEKEEDKISLLNNKCDTSFTKEKSLPLFSGLEILTQFY